MTRAMAKVWRVGVPAEGARAPGVRGGESYRVTSGSQTWHSMQRHPWFPSYAPTLFDSNGLTGGGLAVSHHLEERVAGYNVPTVPVHCGVLG